MRIGLKVALLRTAPFRMSRQESDFRFGSLADIPTSPRPRWAAQAGGLRVHALGKI